MATDTSLERPLPQNLEAERSILGAILLDNHALNAAVERVRSEDFFLSQHRQIFERMVQLAEKQQAIDVVTLMEDLSRRGELESAGGVAYLSQLADGLPRVTNVEHYARIVKEKSVLRNLAFSAAAIQEQALAAGATIVGVNNRNLKSLGVSLETSLRLRQRIPSACRAVSESGIRTPEDMRRLGEAGFDAVLIGERLLVAPDPKKALRELLQGAKAAVSGSSRPA